MIERAITHLSSHGIEAFELMGVLVIPVSDASCLDQKAKDIKRLLDEVGYDKSWSLDPYYKERHESVTGEMYK